MKTKPQHGFLIHAFIIVLSIWVAAYVGFRTLFHNLTGLDAQFAIIPWLLSLYLVPRLTKKLANRL